MLILNLFISSLIIIAGIIIGTQNGLAFTDVNLLWFSFKDVSLSLVIFESFIAGLVIVLIISAIYELKQGILIRRLKKNIKMLHFREHGLDSIGIDPHLLQQRYGFRRE